jgi:hypothetical protein
MVGPHGNAPGSIGYRPIALLLSYTRKLAESGGVAPQPAEPVRLCSKQRPRLGGFTLQKMAEGSGPAPQALRPEPASNRSPRFAVLPSESLKDGGGERSCSPATCAAQSASNGCRHLGRFRLRNPAAGIAPALIRLEDGGLNCSATRRKMAGPVGVAPTLFRVRSAADCLLPTDPNKSGPLARICTWDPAFARPCDRCFTTRRKTEPG